MTKTGGLQKKNRLLDQLAEDLRKLEIDQIVRLELEFKREIRKLLIDYNKSALDVLSILYIIDPEIVSQLD